MTERPMNRYFRTDIPLVVSEDAEGHLIPRTSGFCRMVLLNAKKNPSLLMSEIICTSIAKESIV